jgi:hypothetical protein
MENLASLTSTSQLNTFVKKKRTRKNRIMFAILICTNSFFLVSSLAYGFLSFSKIETEHQYLKLTSLKFNIVAYLNNSVNFVFYGFSSEKYRSFVSNWFHRRRPNRNLKSHNEVKSFFSLSKLKIRRNALVSLSNSRNVEKQLSCINVIPAGDLELGS